MKYLKGSATVEASFIMPVIIFIMLGTIWLCFWFCNRHRLMADVDGAVLYGSECMLTDEGITETELEQYTRELLDKGFLYAKGDLRSVKIDGDEIEVKAYFKMELPLSGYLGELISRFEFMSYTGKTTIYDRCRTRRLVTEADKIIDKIRR